ncbi:hypothetical protein F2Q68_00025012 [Brassica cretica]|uniref:Uncharacterized protein n=1 Tax=Brassica cretica TaxID=69181 RepID=A0A8S9IBK3_BRACR|nr:hypothetical protein F2Q68_00025012 [Brassica cretica]
MENSGSLYTQKKGLFAKLSLTQTWFRDLVLRLPMSGQRLHSLFTGGRPHATALKLSESREVLEVSEDKEGKRLRFISEVEEKDGKALDWFCSYAFSWCL